MIDLRLCGIKSKVLKKIYKRIYLYQKFHRIFLYLAPNESSREQSDKSSFVTSAFLYITLIMFQIARKSLKKTVQRIQVG